MGLNATCLRLIIRNATSLERRERVFTYGAQDIYANYAELEQAFAEMNAAYQSIPPIERELSTSAIFLANKESAERGNVAAAVFFRMLGFSTYTTLDALELDGPVSIRHDLNEPLPASLEGSQDLVVDGGTIEHVFDIATALRSTARLVRPGGLVMHASPVLLYDHGFYGINPTLFRDWYGANDFEILSETTILYDHQHGAYCTNWCFPYTPPFEPPSRLLGRCQVGHFFCARRHTDRPILKTAPLQGMYARAATTKLEVPKRPAALQRIVEALPLAVRHRLSRARDEMQRRRQFKQLAYKL